MPDPRIEKYFCEHRQEMLDDIARLIQVESVAGKTAAGRPFGEKCAVVLQRAVEMAARMGLHAENWENRVAVVDLGPSPARLDILAHLDVVPGGCGWTVTEPFEPLLQDGRLYGRGAIDDKGPAMAALYAMRCVKELDFPLEGGCRLILGADEENGCRDLTYYYSLQNEAAFSFSPDANFPVINTEKGGIYTSYSASWPAEKKLPRVLSVESGRAGNVVPGSARAVVEGLLLSEIIGCIAACEARGIVFTAENLDEPGCVVVEAKGKSAHASTPELGANALSGLLLLLASLPLVEGRGFEALKALAALFPHDDFYGEAAGIAMQDAVSGRLTLCSNTIHFKTTGVTGKIDSRLPLCATKETTLDILAKKMNRAGLFLDPGAELTPPHHVPEDGALVKTLLSCYEDYTAQKGYGIASGGGTYAHRLKNGVGFGCMMPGREYNMHGPDEFLIVDEILCAAKIFAQAIVLLCNQAL